MVCFGPMPRSVSGQCAANTGNTANPSPTNCRYYYYYDDYYYYYYYSCCYYYYYYSTTDATTAAATAISTAPIRSHYHYCYDGCLLLLL